MQQPHGFRFPRGSAPLTSSTRLHGISDYTGTTLFIQISLFRLIPSLKSSTGNVCRVNELCEEGQPGRDFFSRRTNVGWRQEEAILS